jgi:hypothetical protein
MLNASMSASCCRLLHVTYTFVVANIGVANIVPVLNAMLSIGHSASVKEVIFRRAQAGGAEHMDARAKLWPHLPKHPACRSSVVAGG